MKSSTNTLEVKHIAKYFQELPAHQKSLVKEYISNHLEIKPKELDGYIAGKLPKEELRLKLNQVIGLDLRFGPIKQNSK